jgi:membrane dipeptidase
VVVESYGLGLQAPVDADAVNALIEAGASPLEVQDAMEEMGMTGWAEDPALRAEYAEAWAASGVTCTFQNCGEEGNAPLRLIKRFSRHTYMTDTVREVLRRATTPDDIRAAKSEGKHCIYMTTNGVPLPQDWVNVEEELRYIRVFQRLGCRMMHLTYNRRNMIGDGCGEPTDGGLSDFGRAVVKEMNRAGVIVDVAHTGWRTSIDAAKASTRPIVASHSGAHALNAHVRCKTDAVIRAILDTGGLIGITNVPAFLGGRGDITSLLDHIDHVVKTYGIDSVSIGTDRPYVSERRAEAQRKLIARRNRNRWEALWPENDPVHRPEWRKPEQELSLAWTNWPLFTVGLVMRGYSDEEIGKVVGGNILRVAERQGDMGRNREVGR